MAVTYASILIKDSADAFPTGLLDGQLVYVRDTGTWQVFQQQSGQGLVLPTLESTFAANHVTEAKIAANAVTGAKIASGVINQGHVGKGIIKTVTVNISMAAGGVAQTAAVATLPVNSVVVDVHIVATATFNGSTTQNVDVGVVGTLAKYLASSDFETGADDIAAGDEAFASALGSPTVPARVAAGEAVIATWTNTAAATTGAVRVSVSYYVEDV
jgi:hypothetical protein